VVDLNVILATSTYQLLNEQLTRSQSEAEHFRVVAEKLQVVHWLMLLRGLGELVTFVPIFNCSNFFLSD
jgi:hypothetical protein